MQPGVYEAFKKDTTKYYRASVTYKGKHISLGSFDSENDATTAYSTAKNLLENDFLGIEDYKSCCLSFDKWVCLINFRDNNMYCHNPIYLKDKYFYYYFSPDEHLIFDVDDLFYYSSHKISRRNGHLFVSEYGMQVNILSRYGIKNYAVAGRDYIFKNGIKGDFRYSNIDVINHYHGVYQYIENGREHYIAKIHINGDIIIGRYKSESEAAVAYNKAVDILKEKGLQKNFPVNFIVEFDVIKYSSVYNKVRISKKVRDYSV